VLPHQWVAKPLPPWWGKVGMGGRRARAYSRALHPLVTPTLTLPHPGGGDSTPSIVGSCKKPPLIRGPSPPLKPSPDRRGNWMPIWPQYRACPSGLRIRSRRVSHVRQGQNAPWDNRSGEWRRSARRVAGREPLQPRPRTAGAGW